MIANIEQNLTEMNQKQRVFFRGYWITKREMQILITLTKGYTPIEISKELNIKRSTVQTHLHSLYDTFNLHSPQELVVLYYRGKVKEE